MDKKKETEEREREHKKKKGLDTRGKKKEL
jgi:hypothetical protein